MPQRHGIIKAIRHLNRNAKQRKRLFRSQVSQLIELGRIETTYARAHSVKRIVDKVITLGKKGTQKAFNQCLWYVWKKQHATKVFTDLAERYKFRPGGYTRLLRTRRRRGDNAVMCYVELVDRPNELRPANPVSYEYAIAKGLAPPPHPMLPNITEHDRLNIINASPSTSYRANRNSNSAHWFYRDHWIQNTLYPDFKRSAPKPSPAPKFDQQSSTVDDSKV